MNDTPRRASSVWPEMPFARGPVAAERLRHLLPVLQENRAACAARREKVLRHDWARRRLVAIFGYTRADQWNGFVPPARNSAVMGPDGVNTSAARRALLELLDEVDKHEREMRAVEGVA